MIIEDEKLLIEEEKTHTINEIIPQEDKINLQDNLITLINKGVKEGTEQFTSIFSSKLNKGNQKELISESNAKLDEIIKETKKKVNKPLPMNKLPQINAFNTDGMTEDEKRLRRDMIIRYETILIASLIMRSFSRCAGTPCSLSKNSMRRILLVLP